MTSWKSMLQGNRVRRSGMAIYGFTARSLQQVSTLVITLLAARFLLPAEYGIYSLGVVFMILIQTMTYTGFYHFVVNSTEPDDEVLSTSFWMILGLSTAASVLLALAAYPIEWIFDAPELAMVIILLASAQPLASYGAWASAVLLRQERIKTNFHVMFGQNLVSLVIGALLLHFWQSIYALVAFRFVRAILGIGMYLVAGANLPGFRFSKVLARKATSYSGGLYGAQFLNFLSKYSGDILLGLYYTANEVGLYRFGNRVATGATDALVQPMNNFAVTQMGSCARSDRNFKRVLDNFSGTMTLLTGMLSAGIVVFAHDGIALFFQEAYLAAVVVTYALAMKGPGATGRRMLERVLTATGKTGTVMTFNLGLSLATVLSIFAATPFGLSVLAWTQAGIALASSVVAFYLIKSMEHIEIGVAVRRFIIALLISVLYGLAIEAIRLHLVPAFGLTEVPALIAGLACSVAVGPVFLFIGAKLKVFQLSVFSG